MQVKKFEAPTLQEALDHVKRELGPEAIILQTKQNRKGFGLMSKGSVEVTAAVSDRAIDKKKEVERRIPDAYNQKLATMTGTKQADIYESYLEKKVEKEKVQISRNAALADAKAASKRITAVRYADIEDEGERAAERNETYERPAPQQPRAAQSNQNPNNLPQYKAPTHLETAIEDYSSSRDLSLAAIKEEVENLKKLVEELRNERKTPEYIDSDSPFSATEALQEAYDVLLQAGVERRFAVQIMRETGKELSVESRADQEIVLDSVAGRLLKRVETRPFFSETAFVGMQELTAFVGVSGAGKTALLAKLATHASRTRNEKIGVIRIQTSADDGVDPLVVFAKALHIPYRAVSSAEELQVALQDMSQCQRVFIDTRGISSKDQGGIRKLQGILSTQPKIKTQLVISCTTRDLEVREQAKAYSVLSPESLMFTRLDESYSFGSIFSLSRRLGIPISIFSTGRKVTQDWETATPERLTASILNIQ